MLTRSKISSRATSTSKTHKRGNSSRSSNKRASKRSKSGTSKKATNERTKKKFNPETDDIKGTISDDEHQTLNIVFGDEYIDPSELDSRGNIKGLIDYFDEDDYNIYQSAMHDRERRIEQMEQGDYVSFGNINYDDYDEDDDSDYIDGEDDFLMNDSETETDSGNSSDGSDSLSDYGEGGNSIGLKSMVMPLFNFGGGQQQNIKMEERVRNSHLPPMIKSNILDRIKSADLDKPKQAEWVDNLLSVPFGNYSRPPITIDDSKQHIKNFFKQSMDTFDQKVYGLKSVKNEIFNYLAQFITSEHSGVPRVLALCGSAGVGKTYIVRTALAEALNRPLKCINMGGIKDSKAFTGFEYTYSSSRFGNIIQCLVDSHVMNPIICFEEVDKVSQSAEGMDIQYVLMHVTDPEQNNAFQDKYFEGINFDISKCVFVMTLNDPSILNPILLNRLHIINVPDPTLDEKIQIGLRHLLPSVCKNSGFDASSLVVSESIIKFIITRYCKADKGMRTLKKYLESIILRLNSINLIGDDISGKLELTFPLVLTEDIVKKILDSYLPIVSSAVHSMYM